MLALPFCLLFLAFTAWPVLQSLFMSFTDTKSRDLRNPFAVDIVGLDNYTKAFSDPIFRKAMLNTAYFVVVGVPLTLLLALAAAVALDKGITKLRAACSGWASTCRSSPRSWPWPSCGGSCSSRSSA